MKEEIKNMLGKLVGEEKSKKILSNMFPPPIKGYSKGKVLTVRGFRDLPDNSVIHVHYIDEDGNVRSNEFKRKSGEGTTDGFSFPIEDMSPEELIKDCYNCDWTFTIREAVTKSKK